MHFNFYGVCTLLFPTLLQTWVLSKAVLINWLRKSFLQFSCSLKLFKTSCLQAWTPIAESVAVTAVACDGPPGDGVEGVEDRYHAGGQPDRHHQQLPPPLPHQALSPVIWLSNRSLALRSCITLPPYLQVGWLSRYIRNFFHTPPLFFDSIYSSAHPPPPDLHR